MGIRIKKIFSLKKKVEEKNISTLDALNSIEQLINEFSADNNVSELDIYIEEIRKVKRLQNRFNEVEVSIADLAFKKKELLNALS